jgi:acetyl esterase/lipase
MFKSTLIFSLGISITLSYMTSFSSSAQTVIPLWNGPAPKSHGSAPEDIPSLTVFLPENAGPATPAIIVFPGGGYEMLAFDYEGINEAKYFQERGVAGFVLKYRLPKNGYLHPVPLIDAQRAIRLVRSRAAEWKINSDKVGIMGFSAGGHLASTLETHYDAGNPQATDPIDRLSCRPNFAVLVYPVICTQGPAAHLGCMHNLLGPNPDPALVASLSNETQVTPQTPPTILVHAADDTVVSIENSRLMLAALKKAGVPSVLDEYPHGEHGFGYGPNQKSAPPGWMDKVYDWLKSQSLMP